MNYRAGFLGLIGQPNAGKSTLLNLLVDSKVSIVTSKPQTTRRRTVGMLNGEGFQLCIVDAPGVIKASAGLNSFLEREVQDVIQSSDALIAVLNIDEEHKENLDKILEMVKVSQKPWFALITKTDLVQYSHRIDRLKEEIRKISPTVEILEVSEKWRNDLGEFRQKFASAATRLLPESAAPLYDIELFTPHTERELAAEIIREKCFEELHQEVPYNLAVRIIKYDEEDERIRRIYAEIVLAKENHKAIVIGKGGAQIKNIGTKARKTLESFLGTKVFLDLKVAVREEWFLNERMMKELGYVVDSE